MHPRTSCVNPSRAPPSLHGGLLPITLRCQIYRFPHDAFLFSSLCTRTNCETVSPAGVCTWMCVETRVKYAMKIDHRIMELRVSAWCTTRENNPVLRHTLAALTLSLTRTQSRKHSHAHTYTYILKLVRRRSRSEKYKSCTRMVRVSRDKWTWSFGRGLLDV